MNPELEKFYDTDNDIFGNPQEYKTLKIYPIKIKDHKYLKLFYKLFTYPQISESMKNPMIYKISYLKFMIYFLGINIEEELFKFLKYIFKEENIKPIFENIIQISENEIDIKNLIIKLKIGETIINEQDFNIIREIVLEQNGLSYNYIEDYKEEIEKYFQHKNKMDSNNLNFQDQVAVFAGLYNKTIKEIEDQTIYQMIFLTNIKQNILEYDKNIIDLTNVDHEKYKMDHYAKHFKRTMGRYDSILVDVDEFKSSTNIEIT